MTNRVSMRPIAVFLAVAFGGAWLVALPLWLSGEGLATPGATIYLVAMMFTPAIAALVAHRVDRVGRFVDATTLKPRLPFHRWLRYAGIAWLAPIAVTLLAVLVSAAFGFFRFDLVEFSGAEQLIAELTGGADIGMPISMLVMMQLATMFISPALNVIPAMGEELGWRGFLQTRLLPLGQWPAVIITGVVWGLWHAPVILLGYNYPGQHPVVALLLMVVFCVLISVLLGWMTIASGTVWTAAIAHGFVNGVASMGVLLGSADPTDSALVGLLGVSGWIVMAVLIAVLVLLRRFPVRGAEAQTDAAVEATEETVSAS